MVGARTKATFNNNLKRPPTTTYLLAFLVLMELPFSWLQDKQWLEPGPKHSWQVRWQGRHTDSCKITIFRIYNKAQNRQSKYMYSAPTVS
jgi:hypothetical protein